MTKTDEARIAEVLAAERAWVNAHRSLDLETLEAIMAEEYKAIQPDGRVLDKGTELASYRSGTRTWEFADSDEYDVEIFNETAVLIGRWRAKGVNSGVPFNYAARFLAVYINRDGRWQLAAAQSTTIPGQK